MITDGQSKSDLFTLLLRPSERRHEDAVTRFVNDILRPTRQAWYDPASSEARVPAPARFLSGGQVLSQVRRVDWLSLRVEIETLEKNSFGK